jgi:predicted AlkP superfamily pyrophosphatase or phosphodiesterase
MLFWQQSLGENVDMVLSPAPIHKHSGGVIKGCYCRPIGLYSRLCRRIGRPFKLHQYWGPLATWKVGDWIVEATSAVLEDPDMPPDLCLTYLPTLDYDFQKRNPDTGPACNRARKNLEEQLGRLVHQAGRLGYEILIFGDYAIGPVHGAVFPNIALRQAGLMNVRSVNGMMYPDFYSSRAFTVADHEIAHVYAAKEDDVSSAKEVLAQVAGVGDILDRDAQAKMKVDHPNSGELIIVAENGKWFAYPWWTRRREAPEYAGHVDIHNKPGYDPCELFFGWPPGTVSRNTERIRGSHGRAGPQREVAWAASFPIRGNPTDLTQLADAVRRWLEETI